MPVHPEVYARDIGKFDAEIAATREIIATKEADLRQDRARLTDLTDRRQKYVKEWGEASVDASQA